MTPLELVKFEAARFTETLTDDEAEHVLWGFTGFPSFWSPLGPHRAGETTVEEVLGFELRVYFWEVACRRWLALPPAVDYCERYSLDNLPDRRYGETIVQRDIKPDKKRKT